MELYGKHYTLSWPHEEHESGRPVLTSPIYEILKEQGACFGSKLGWERPNWFAPEDETAKDIYSYGRQNWFPHVGKEHRAVRERVALFDQSSFAKFLIIGIDAEKALNRICANNVAKPSGVLTYTQMLNSNGGIECDLTVARLAKDEFYLVSGTGFRTHDSAWIRSQFLADEKDVDMPAEKEHLSGLLESLMSHEEVRRLGLACDFNQAVEVGARLTELIGQQGIVQIPGAHNALAGLLAKRAGFECLYVSVARVWKFDDTDYRRHRMRVFTQYVEARIYWEYTQHHRLRPALHYKKGKTED